MIIKNLTRNKYIGIRQRKEISPVTRLIYKGKFLQETQAINELAAILIMQLHNIDFDVIVPVRCSKSKVSLPERLAEIIAEERSCKLLKSGLKVGNKIASPGLKNKKVLILDDVVYKGTTARKAIRAVKKSKPEKIYFLAAAQSSKLSFKS